MGGRLLVVSPLDVAGSRNSRTHHVVRHLAPHFGETVVISKTNITRRTRREQWVNLVCMRTEAHREENITWIALSPIGNIRHGLGLHLLGIVNPYQDSRLGLRRILRPILSSLGVVFELGILPSLLITYAVRVRACVDVTIAEGPWEAIFGMILRMLGRTRILVYDDIDYQPGFQAISGLRRRLTAALEQFGIRRADSVITVSDRLWRLRQAQGARKLRVIPNGVDGDRFETAHLARVTSTRRPPTIVYIGYLGAWAGTDLLLNSTAIAARRIPTLRMIILGHGAPEEVAALRAGCAALRLGAVVEYRGEVAYRDLPAHLADADIALAMFRPLDLTRYAFPLKVIEYMAAGLPVVTTEDTEAADVLTRAEAGVAVPFDAEAVADAVTTMLQDAEARHRYAENGKRFSKSYDWQGLMAEYRSVIEETLSLS